MALGAVLAVAAAVFLLVVLLAPSGGPFSSKASAALTRLAAQAAAAAPTQLGAGQYAYTEVERPVMTSVGSTKPGGPPDHRVLHRDSANVGRCRRLGTPGDHHRPGTALLYRGGPDRLGGRREPAWRHTPEPTRHRAAIRARHRVGGQRAHPSLQRDRAPHRADRIEQLLDNENPGAQSLGTLPAGIKSLDFASSCETAVCTLFERATALLQGPDIGATPALRQALFQVLATVPGVEDLGTTTDPSGQSGVELALVEHQPAGTTVIDCGHSDQPSSQSAGAIRYGGSTDNSSITSSTTERYPASSITFSIVVDPQSTTLMSSEESYSPLIRTMPASPPCLPASPGSQKTETTEMGPNWQDVVNSGIASSDTSVPSGGPE